MPSSLRVASTDPGAFTPLIGDADTLHGRLQALIRRHLPSVTASLLAEPRIAPGGGAIDWYSDLAGQPVPFAALGEREQAAARQRLHDRLASLVRLADELPALAPEAAELADPLRLAARNPGEDCVYLVGDQPVVIFWGHTRNGAAPPVAGSLPSAAGWSAAGRSIWPWFLLLLLLAMGALGGRFWQQDRQARELEGELAEAMAEGCDRGGALDALIRRLSTLDPVEARYPEIWAQVKDRREHCAAAERFSGELAAARGDCLRLDRLRGALSARTPSERPFGALYSELEAALAVCAQAADFEARVAAAMGDCAALAELGRALGTPPDDAVPLLRLRARLDDELARCAAAERLSQALAERRGDCPELNRLDGELSTLDSTRAPLRVVRMDLDLELDLCSRADQYAQALLAAQSDCSALAALEADMRGEPVGRDPLRPLHARLGELLAQCTSLDDLARALEEARGDCAKLTLLEGRLEQESPANPLFVAIRTAVLEERRECELAAALDRALADAAGDCAALAALEPRLAESPRAEPRFAPLYARWEDGMARCRLAETLKRKLAAAGSDCARLDALTAELAAVPPQTPGIDDLRTRLASASAPCRPPAAPAVARAGRELPATSTKGGREPPDVRPKKGKILCPGERPKELAPDLVMVFDASASMDRPIAQSAALGAVRRGLQLGGLAGAALGILVDQAARGAGGQRRIEVAKDAAGRIVGSLPGDVAVGLVLVEDCPSARSVGFFGAGQRGALIRGINGIHPVGGTPLAAGIERAASMVDGVRKPAVMVILSDGKESCHRDPCAVARQVAQRKPQLTINVVDITGTGAGNCAARATGGKVYTANNAAEVRAMMQRATQDVRGPPECRRK